VTYERTQSIARRFPQLAIGVLGLSVLAVAGCKNSIQRPQPQTVTLRVGVGGLPQQSPEAGLRQFVNSLTFEALAAPNDDGRLRPVLAEGWTLAPDGLSLTVRISPRAKFHDGKVVDATMVVQSLKKGLPAFMGPAFEDIDRVEAVDVSTVRVILKRRSQFVLEALETTIQETGAPGVGTGPFVAESTGRAPTILDANPVFYRERPAIERISVTSYPSVRAAWADLLRGNLDMLYEVSIDGLDSLQGASNVAVFSFVRHYQYMLLFGRRAPMFQSVEVRRELAAAIDRDAIVREALNGHGVASTGPVPPDHWARSATRLPPPPKDLANRLAARHLKFKCLVPADSVYERVALAVRRQLAAVSVDMEVEQATQEEVMRAINAENYDALLGDIVSGPTLLRSYRRWYSKAGVSPLAIPSGRIDSALDQIRHAESDDEYRNGVAAFEQAIADEPPALFLAWSERARAVSRRFEVAKPENGRDVLNSIRLWRPAPETVSTN
jgi:peptide/nickel transport system substrate-binding protein